MNPPTEAEALTLLRHGNPGRKNFVAWFMEKVIFHNPLLNTHFNIYLLTELMHATISIILVGKRSKHIYG